MAVDVPKCPICYEIISEPVVYPCQHEVCKECFERSMETANLWCPLCRKRVSSWARRNVRNPVDAKRRIEIQKVLASPHQDLLENESGTSIKYKFIKCVRMHVLMYKYLCSTNLLGQQTRGNSARVLGRSLQGWIE